MIRQVKDWNRPFRHLFFMQNSSLRYLNFSYYNLVKNLEDSKSVVNLTALFHIAQISAFFEASVAEDLLDPTK